MMALLLAFTSATTAYAKGGHVKGASSGAVGQVAAEAKTDFQPIMTKTSAIYRFTGPLTQVYQNPSPKMAPAYAAENLPTIYGNVIFSQNDMFKTGAMYKIPLTASGSLEYVGGDEIYANRGGVEVGDRYMAHTAETNSYGVVTGMYIRKLDTSFWDQKAKNSSVKVGTMATDVALDPTTNTVYGCFYNDDQSGYVLGKMDYSTYKRTAIADLTTGWNACAIDAQGQLYAIENNGRLVKVNKETAEITPVGMTGVTPKYLSSACIDPVSGRMFYAASPADESGKLFEIDLATGEATLICHFPGNEEIVGMYIPTPLAADKAPAAVDNLVADFPEGTLKGHVNFTAPTTTFDGEPTSGELSYTVMNKTTKVAEGTTSCGEPVSVEIEISKAAKCEFIVTVANEVGSGPKSRVMMYVGKDKPVAPEVTSTYADGKFTVSWNPVTESVNGGYMNAAAVTYKVVRKPDNVTVANGISETSIVDEVAASDTEYVRYYYAVTATADGLSSEAGNSNSIGLGQVMPPYTETFDASLALNTFTIIDGNNDGKVWGYNNKKARMRENASLAMDDWLITPPVKLEKNKIYKFSMVLTTSKTYTERFEVRFGKGNTVADMTGTVVKAQDVNAGDGQTFTGYVKADEDGLYYVGIHGISKKNQFYIDIDDLSLEAGTTALVPDAPTAFSITPDASGALTATLEFKAPAINLLGNELTSLDKIEILRDGNVIETKQHPEVGGKISFKDEAAATGKHVYTVVGYNEHGRGWEAVDSAFVGVNIPGPAIDVVAKETTNVGEVKVSWIVPESDIDGFEINPDLITYDLISVCGETTTLVAEGLTETTHTYRAVEADTPQEFYYYQVVAKTSAGSTPAVSASIAVGKPDTAPYFESFANGIPSHAIEGAPVSGDCTWALYTDANNLGVKSSDSDNGFAASAGVNGTDAAVLFTGKIDLTGIARPVVTFETYNIPSSSGEINDRNSIEILVNNGNRDKSVMFIEEIRTLGPAGWNKVYVPLDAYSGKTVSVKFISTVKAYKYTLIDDIRVIDWLDYNLTATAIEAPAKVAPDTDFNVAVTIENAGTQKARGYTVDLYRDDEKIASLPGEDIESTKAATIMFTTQLGVINTEPVSYHAVINYTSDMDKDDNTTEKATTTVKMPKYPAASNLAATAEGATVTLTWEKPVLDSAPVSVTEGFDNAESFAINEVEDWTFIDGDGLKTYGIQDVNFPNTNSPMAYIVLDKTFEGLEDVVKPRSGNKVLATFASVKGANDDWAISPLLYGTAQQVSFYATAFGADYEETFEFYYSTTGMAIEDFVQVGETKTVKNTWTKFDFDIPEGSKYFAIRCTSDDQYIFMIDDVTFIPAGPGAGLTLTGYNAYRDGEMVNKSLITVPSFVDNEVPNGNHSYVVTAVYDKGESTPSNVADIAVSGIDDVTTNVTDVTVEGRVINIANAYGQAVSIVTVDGKVIYNDVASVETVKYEAAPGIYVVSVAGRAVKVIVK